MGEVFDILYSFYHTIGLNGVLALFGIPVLGQLLILVFAKAKLSKFVIPIVIMLFTFFLYLVVYSEGGFESYSNGQIVFYLLGCAMIPITMFLGALTGGLSGRAVVKLRKKRSSKEEGEGNCTCT